MINIGYAKICYLTRPTLLNIRSSWSLLNEIAVMLFRSIKKIEMSGIDF